MDCPRILLTIGFSISIAFDEFFVITLEGFGLIGDFSDVLEAKLSVETELSLEDESDLLLDKPGLNISLVGTFFSTIGDFNDDTEEALVLTIGDNGVVVFTVSDNGVLLLIAADTEVLGFAVGDDTEVLVFKTGDTGVFIIEEHKVFISISGSNFVTGDLGVKLLEVNSGITLVFIVVDDVDFIEIVDLIDVGDFTDNNDKELCSFFTIVFGEVGPVLEIKLDLLVIDLTGNVFTELDSLITDFEGEGVFKEIDFTLEAVDGLLFIDDFIVGEDGNCTPVTVFGDNTSVFFTGLVGFKTFA
jgi:hypothetical protein